MNGLDNSFTVRRATAADLDSMVAIWLETAEMLARADRRIRIAPQGESLWRAAMMGYLARDDMAVFLADRRGSAIGYLVGAVVNNPGFIPDRSGLVQELAVDSHGKAGGIGRELVHSFRGWLAERQITAIEARVPVMHPVAQAFWRASGADTLFEHMRVRR
ncbi:MAG TPA: GNAT family N-acetyltransferase [Aggregatilineales bacterium]|nr:GNAT family N-acetyltransferase [Aggregatilineales bacterium]